MATLKQSPAMMARWLDLMEQKGSSQFRRSDLAERLFSLTNPRSREKALEHADAIMKRAAKKGEIVRIGQVHWRRVVTKRTLRSGREVKELERLTELALQTHCPDKWVSIDLETGDIWVGSDTGWKRAAGDVQREVRDLLSRS